jgi:Immunoglobulin-like domain of bacterial spore germination/Sporulation and spore germination
LQGDTRLKYSWIVVLALAACSPPVEKASEKPPATVIPAQTTTIAEEPAQKPAEKPNITIDKVEIGNPLVVSGLARTFENNVVFRAKGADGTVLAESFTTSTGEMGHHNPYSGSLWLTREPGQRIVVEALEYSARDGAETNLVRIEEPFAVESIETTLYFPDEQCTGAKPYTRRMPKSISMARLLAEALVHGPTAGERARGAAQTFPEGSRVQSVILRNGVLTVDFNERLQNVGGSCRAQMIRTTVTETMRRLPTVREVVITAAGNDKLALQP